MGWMSIRLPEGELARITHEMQVIDGLEAVGTYETHEPTYTLDGQPITRERAVELLEAEQARQARPDVRPAREWL